MGKSFWEHDVSSQIDGKVHHLQSFVGISYSIYLGMTIIISSGNRY